MRLKRLEMIGFKSFLDKTKLKFESGVTGIVGPNGCGKSNIVDAIKWVLGEQSVKSMRSSAMQDVIFNGTDKQDPVSMAEVAITLSNEDRSLPLDYDEVTISRRLFRSGESEYLLNKTPVRLTDIRNILMGTGIGTSSYSIIEQGRMDMILSSRPEDRRYVFEEASGITRYKSKKREALLKLEHTHDNLTRINDIVREVERQIKSIERQARKAERYKSRYDELKDLEVKLSYKKYHDLANSDTSMGTEDNSLKEMTDALRVQLDGATENLAGKRSEFNKLIEDLQATHNEVLRLTSEIDKNELNIKVNEERVFELRKYIDRLNWEIDDVAGRKESLSGRIGTLEARFQEVSSRRQEKEHEFNSSEEVIRNITQLTEQLKQDLSSSREKTIDLVGEQTRFKNDLIRMNADLQNMKSRERRLRLEQNNVAVEKESVGGELRSIEERVSREKIRVEEKARDFQIFNNEYISREQVLYTLKEKRAGKEKRINEIIPRREFLEKLISEREGINDSTKEIMKLVDEKDERFMGVHGVLSEIISVEENYEESMEHLLGELSQAVVVANRTVADNVVNHLREKSLGSVNFIILDELENMMEWKDGPFSTNVVLNDITHILKGEENYKRAIRNMLSDIFVSSSGEAARTALERGIGKGRIIGKFGEIYQRGAHRSRNFSDKKSISLFGRQEKAEHLRQEEEEIARELNSILEEITNLEFWLKESLVKKDRLETELRTMQIEFADISSRKISIKEKFDSLADELSLLEVELEEEVSSIRELHERGEGVNIRLNELEAASASLQSEIDEFQGNIQEQARRREEVLFQISDMKAELSGLRTEETNLSENLERARESFCRIEDGVNEKRSRIDENSDKITTLNGEIEHLEERNIECIALKEVRMQEDKEKARQKEELSGAISQEEERIRSEERRLEGARNSLRDLDIKKKEVEYKQEALVTRISDTYKVRLTEVNIELDESFNQEECERNVADLRDQLDKMGQVSLGAVEEHRELQERFEFLSKQRDDLTQARESLMQAIRKINTTTRKMFMDTFEAIQKEFSNYFRMLFNGGKAELVLEDETNPLECGIDIVVRPPGKKLQNIMLLSGGEKAMTAIALIFAIFRVNPSPFCILDEIDAPLDESNVVRFSRVLKEFLKLSQFIIVTHNRMTIQLADILYGITMQEKGVSKVVSVKFAEEADNLEEETIPAAI